MFLCLSLYPHSNIDHGHETIKNRLFAMYLREIMEMLRKAHKHARMLHEPRHFCYHSVIKIVGYWQLYVLPLCQYLDIKEKENKMSNKEKYFPYTDRVPQTMEEWLDAGHTNDQYAIGVGTTLSMTVGSPYAQAVGSPQSMTVGTALSMPVGSPYSVRTMFLVLFCIRSCIIHLIKLFRKCSI